MLFSFESPICLLKKSLQYNDYDFILFHLLKKYPKYRNFYLNSKKFKILDNSAYEFFVKKEEFKEEEFIETIKEINPNVYIVPDTLMDSTNTIFKFENWIKKYPYISNKKMVVIQGKTFEDWLECYMYFYKKQEYFDYVGISFHYDFLKTIGKAFSIPDIPNTLEKDFQYALGRKFLIKFLINYDLIMKGKPYHLLGSHIGHHEFMWYKETSFIKTIDTGLPIKYGIKEIKCDKIQEKPDIILDDFINKKLSKNQIKTIEHNINIFKLNF